MAQGLNIEEFISKVNEMLGALPRSVAEINEGLAASAIPMIIDRLTELGTDGKGKKLGTYSDNPLPTFFYLHKGTGSGADQALESAIKKKRKEQGKNFKGISYKEFRELNNRPTNFVTLSFTGETLADLGVIQTLIESTVVVVMVGAQNKTTKATRDAKGNIKGRITTGQVLEYLGERYGENILALTGDEEEILANAFDVELQNFLNKYLL